MAWHSVIVNDHIRRIPLIESAQPHSLTVDRILAEMLMEELFSKGIESCYMEFPVRVLFLKPVMNRRAVYILHRNKDQIQLLRKLFVRLLREQFLQKNERCIRAGHLVCMVSRIDNLGRAVRQTLRHGEIALPLWLQPDRVKLSSCVRSRGSENFNSRNVL